MLLTTSALTCAASSWSRGQAQSEPAPQQQRLSTTPQADYLRARGISSPGRAIRNGATGQLPTPRTNRLRANIMKSPQNPRGTLYGVVNRFSGIESVNQAYIGSLDLASGRMTPLHTGRLYCPYADDDYMLQTNSYRQGEVICPHVELGQTYQVSWDFIDLESGSLTRTIDFGNNMFANPYSMTYDPTDDLLYLVCIDGETDGQFSTVDPKNDYAVNYIGNLRQKGGFIAAIAYNEKDGQIYAFNNYNTVYTLDKRNGTLVEAGYLELPTDELLFTEGISGQVVYSPADEMFVAIFRDNAIEETRILYIHPDTFEVFEGEIVKAPATPYITALLCTDDYALPDAPELAPAPVIDFDGAALAGHVTVTAPSYTYAGVELGSTDVTAVLLVDGEEYMNHTMHPGESVAVDLNLREGEHQLTFYTMIGDNRSPQNRMAFYVGNDTPLSPSALRLDGNLLSWKAPGASGVHKGYVETAALTYDVYLAGVKQNSAPIADLSYQLTMPGEINLYDISVVASANGHASEPATIQAVYGAAMPLPFHQLPSLAESRLYTTENSNGDDREWEFTYPVDEPESTPGDAMGGEEVEEVDLYGWYFLTGYTRSADDWLFLPDVEITDPSTLYTIAYTLTGLYSFETSESYEIWIGRQHTSKSMREGTCIFSTSDCRASLTPASLTHEFAVSEAGSYVIGFHFTGSTAQESQGIVICDFDIRELDGTTSAIPADPTDVSITAAPQGANRAIATLTLPTLDMAGKTLPVSESITVTLSDQDDPSATASASGLPGGTLTIELDLAKGGFHYLNLTPSNANGKGYQRTYRAYIGIDRPMAPTGLKSVTSADNLSIHLEWEAPGTTGLNGGYVNPDALTYNVYARADSNNAMRVGQTADNEYDYSPFSVANPAMVSYGLGVSALSEGGESTDTYFTVETLGTPSELPVLEEWGTVNFTYGPYVAMTTGSYAASAWQSTGSMTGMAIGDPLFVQGGLVAFATAEGRVPAKVVLPKVTTTGIAKANFILRYWDYANAPEAISVYGRRFGQDDEKLLSEFRPERGAAKWVDASMPLPDDYMNAPWVEIRLGCEFEGKATNEYLVLDSYQFFPDADYDLKVTALSGNTQICLGQLATYHAVVANSGRERISGTLTMSLRDTDGNEYGCVTEEIPMLNSNQVFEMDADFDINGALRDKKELNVVAEVTCDRDENMANNRRTLPLTLLGSQLPVVNDLRGEIADGGVQLAWSVPPTEYGDFESFETLKPFEVTESLGMWQNYDFDGLNPYPIINNATGEPLAWEGSDQPQGWTVVDVQKIGYMNDERMAPHSGTRVLMARAGDYPDAENPIQSDKWLVSPEIVGGTELSFWLSTLASDCAEYLEVWYSETDTTLNPANATSTRNGSFRRARTFSKEGADAWELIKCTLPASARYFAIRYTSYDGIAVVIDDLSFTPAHMLDHTISNYALYRSDNGGSYKLVADDITSNSYTDSKWADSKAWYYLLTYVDIDGEKMAGPRSNGTYIAGSGVAEVAADAAISAEGTTVILHGLMGQDYSIVATDGKTIASGRVSASNFAVSLAPGIYTVVAGPLTLKLILH